MIYHGELGSEIITLSAWPHLGTLFVFSLGDAGFFVLSFITRKLAATL